MNRDFHPVSTFAVMGALLLLTRTTAFLPESVRRKTECTIDPPRAGFSPTISIEAPRLIFYSLGSLSVRRLLISLKSIVYSCKM